jgi:hypothetical protein
MRIRKVVIGILATSCLSFAAQSEAAETSTANAYVSALLGVGLVNNSGGSNFTYGVGVGYKLNPSYSLGLDYTYNTFSVPSPLSASLSLILANFKYYFAGGFLAGVKLGSGMLSYSGPSAPSTTSNFAWGPSVGYDYACTTNWSIGADADLIWLSSSPVSVNDLQMLASLKYWF